MNRSKSGISGSIYSHSDLEIHPLNSIQLISNDFLECSPDEISYDQIVFKKFVRCQRYRDNDLSSIKASIQKQMTNINDNENYCKAIGEIANNILVISSLQKDSLNVSPFYLSNKGKLVLFAIIESSQGYELMSVYQKFCGDISDTVFRHHNFIDIANYLLQSVSLLHQSGYYHLDIKLGNILYDNMMNYSLCDFGSLADINCDNTHRGTRPYMSPLTDFNKQELKNHYLKLMKQPLVDNYFESYKNIRKIQMHVVLPYFESISEGSKLDLSEIYHPEMVKLMEIIFPTYPAILKNYSSRHDDGIKITAISIQKLILQKTDLHAIGMSLLALAKKNSLSIENKLYQWILNLVLGDVEINYYNAQSAEKDFKTLFS